MDKQARLARIEGLLAMEVDLDNLYEFPLPERFQKLVEWAEKHLSPVEQEWLYEQWQRALEGSVERSQEDSHGLE